MEIEILAFLPAQNYYKSKCHLDKLHIIKIIK